MEVKEEAVKLIEYIPIMMVIVLSASFFVSLPFIQRLRMMRWNYLKVVRNNNDIPLHTIRIKPFDCSTCLSFWIMLLTTIYFHEGIFNVIFISFATPSLINQLKK